MNLNRKFAAPVLAALISPMFLVSAPAAMAAETTGTRGCASGALPSVVLGSPEVKAGQALGVYLWHDANGYSLRVTKPGRERVVISGTITVNRHITSVKRVALESRDRVRVGPYRHRIHFRFTNYGYVDGFTFKAQCSRTVRVQLKIGNVQATPSQVFLGKDRTNPTSVPFTIERARAGMAARVAP
jgi:hypothetical protein